MLLSQGGTERQGAIINTVLLLFQHHGHCHGFINKQHRLLIFESHGRRPQVLTYTNLHQIKGQWVRPIRLTYSTKQTFVHFLCYSEFERGYGKLTRGIHFDHFADKRKASTPSNCLLSVTLHHIKSQFSAQILIWFAFPIVSVTEPYECPNAQVGYKYILALQKDAH